MECRERNTAREVSASDDMGSDVKVMLIDGKEAALLSGQRPKERWYGMDWLRFICIFYVVFGHTYKVLRSIAHPLAR